MPSYPCTVLILTFSLTIHSATVARQPSTGFLRHSLALYKLIKKAKSNESNVEKIKVKKGLNHTQISMKPYMIDL